MNNNTTVSTTTAMPLGSQKKHRKVEHCRVDFSKNAIVITGREKEGGLYDNSSHK